jgi:hypothetical protein
MILQLNPSYSSREFDGPRDSERLQRDLDSLKDESHNHLGVALKDGWWAPRLGQLVSDLGRDLLARSICSVEFFPYRSRHFAHGQVRLPSQGYTFSLVRKALERDALLLVTRNFQLWVSAIPELHARRNEVVIELKNPRNSYFSERNMPTGAYGRIVKAIQRQAKQA